MAIGQPVNESEGNILQVELRQNDVKKGYSIYRDSPPEAL